jgi:hypothetical protein
MIEKQNKIDVSMFLISSVLVLFTGVSYFLVSTDITKERCSNNKEAELQSLSFELSNASNYLTEEVRKFAITLAPVHLRNYWTEINITKTREKTITRLLDLEIPKSEFEFLNRAKNKSDDLIHTEIRAMKLVLRVYEVPKEQMEPDVRDYQLTNEDESLSFNQKVNLAREILYNSEYDAKKKEIMALINEFDTKMRARIHQETNRAILDTNRSQTLLLIAIIAVFIYLLYLVWFFLYRISIPLKNYLMDLMQEGENNHPEKQLLRTEKFVEEIQTILRKRKA